MKSSRDYETRTSPPAVSPLQQVLTTSLAHEAHDVVRHLGRVLDIQKDEQVLLIPGEGVLAALTLVGDYDCHVSILSAAGDEQAVQPADERITRHTGTPGALPFQAASFDVVIVAVPVTTGLQRVSRELARVLKRSGRLGMVALSPYHDQVTDEGVAIFTQPETTGQIRPAAAYRAVLGEAGFTAFLAEDRRRALRQSAQTIYREHMLQSPADPAPTLGLLAAGGVSMTLLTAEKGF